MSNDKINKIAISVLEDIADSEKLLNTIKNNQFIMFPFDFTSKYYEDSSLLNINTGVRIIKDLSYNDHNLRYFTGKIEAITKNKEDDDVYTIKLEYPFPYDDNIETIDVLKSFIEPLSFENSLVSYFNYLQENKTVLANTGIESSDNYAKDDDENI